MDSGLSLQSFTSKLEECDERIAKAERNVATQRGIIANRLRWGLSISLPLETLRQSLLLLEEMRKARVYVLKHYGYEGQSTRKPRLTVL